MDGLVGTIVMAGPKALEFYKQFSNHRATFMRADDKDILSVRMHLNSEGQAEEDIFRLGPEKAGANEVNLRGNASTRDESDSSCDILNLL
jgi:hypothetical protein